MAEPDPRYLQTQTDHNQAVASGTVSSRTLAENPDGTPATNQFADIPLIEKPSSNVKNFPTLTESTRDDMLPRAVGRFLLIELLGEGAMGQVYRVFDQTLDREVAVKFIQPKRSAYAEERANFLREARSMAKINHDNVIAVHQVDEVDNIPFIVMPLLKGQTLENFLKKNPRPPIRILLQVAREVAAGLSAAHMRGQIHRDIKPSNIWLEDIGQDEFRVKILDFGLARDSREPGASGGVVGTPVYMSPEQASNEPLDERSDLFSLGVMLYQMATGKLVFLRSTKLATLLAVREDQVPPILNEDAEFPTKFAELIEELLAKNPEARPGTAQTVYRRVRELEGDPSSSHRSSPDLFLPDSSAPFPRWLLPLGLFCLSVSITWFIVDAQKLDELKDEPNPFTSLDQKVDWVVDPKYLEELPAPRVNEIGAGLQSDSLYFEMDFRVSLRNTGLRPIPISDRTRMPLRVGDHIQLELASEIACYWYLFYLDAGGQIVLLYPSTPLQTHRSQLQLPEATEGNGIPLTAGPSGTEMMIAVCRERPLTPLERDQLRLQLQAKAPRELPPIPTYEWLHRENLTSARSNWLKEILIPFGVSWQGIGFAFQGLPD